MNAETIRVMKHRVLEDGAPFTQVQAERAKLQILRELTAQVAEANENLKRIAYPPIAMLSEEEHRRAERDKIAIAVLASYFGSDASNLWESKYYGDVARRAYEWADALLEARKL